MISLATLQQLSHSTGHLVMMNFSPEIRLCSYGNVTAGGHEWQPGDVTPSPLDVDETGVSAITLTLAEDHWGLFFQEQFEPNIACEWHLLYRGSRGWETEQIFDGFLDQPRILRDGSVRVEAAVVAGDTAVAPRIPFESPYSLARGSELVINGTTYVVE